MCSKHDNQWSLTLSQIKYLHYMHTLKLPYNNNLKQHMMTHYAQPSNIIVRNSILSQLTTIQTFKILIHLFL